MVMLSKASLFRPPLFTFLLNLGGAEKKQREVVQVHKNSGQSARVSNKLNFQGVA